MTRVTANAVGTPRAYLSAPPPSSPALAASTSMMPGSPPFGAATALALRRRNRPTVYHHQRVLSHSKRCGGFAGVPVRPASTLRRARHLNIHAARVGSPTRSCRPRPLGRRSSAYRHHHDPCHCKRSGHAAGVPVRPFFRCFDYHGPCCHDARAAQGVSSRRSGATRLCVA